MKWKYRNVDDIKYQKLKKIDNISELLARVAAGRPGPVEHIENLILDPVGSFTELQTEFQRTKELEEVASKIKEYAEAPNREIWVFGDYDTDGLTSGYIMTDFLRKVSNNKIYAFFPEKAEGYGLSVEFCNNLITYKNETGKEDNSILVVTVDNGTSCMTTVDLLQKNKIEVVVTDHHQPKQKLPNCKIFNPQIGEDSAGKELAGCGVAFKVVQEVERQMGMERFSVTSHYLPYVAIGTVADMMPMTGENPFLVRVGLDALLWEDGEAEFLPLLRWKEMLGIKDTTFTKKDVSWTLAPRLNSCGRMGDIMKGAGLLFSQDIDDVEEFAMAIENLDKQRKKITKKVFEEVTKNTGRFDNMAVCYHDCTGVPAGVAGGIANKMLETFGKPAFVFSKSDKHIVGSARSLDYLPLPELMERELGQGNITAYGGHTQACGFELEEDKLESFIDSIDTAIRTAMQFAEPVEATMLIDADIQIEDINETNYNQLSNFILDDDAIVNLQKVKVNGTKCSKSNPNNICFNIDYRKYGMNIWAWGMANKYEEIGKPEYIDIAGTIDADFMSPGKYTLKVLDFRPANQPS